jgi:hypothetical protein
MLKGWLKRPGVLRRFNIVMAALLVASILPGLAHAMMRIA